MYKDASFQKEKGNDVDIEISEPLRKRLHEIKNKVQEVFLIVDSCVFLQGKIDPTKRLQLLQTKLIEVRNALADLVNNNSNGTPSKDRSLLNPAKILEEMFSPWSQRISLDLSQESLNFRIYGNEEDFRKVIENLVLNAFEAGATRVDITCQTDGNKMRVVIKDNGKGIRVEDLPFIFLPGFSTKKRGSGIGLYQVWECSTKNGWEIKVRPLKKGTEFSLEIPSSSQT